MSQQKKSQAEKSYGNGSDMEKFAEETNIKNSDGNNLMAKAKALKNFKKLFISVQFLE